MYGMLRLDSTINIKYRYDLTAIGRNWDYAKLIKVMQINSTS
jgi:hypothetical protein